MPLPLLLLVTLHINHFRLSVSASTSALALSFPFSLYLSTASCTLSSKTMTSACSVIPASMSACSVITSALPSLIFIQQRRDDVACPISVNFGRSLAEGDVTAWSWAVGDYASARWCRSGQRWSGRCSKKSHFYLHELATRRLLRQLSPSVHPRTLICPHGSEVAIPRRTVEEASAPCTEKMSDANIDYAFPPVGGNDTAPCTFGYISPS